jgi:hypothetical protein
MCGTPKIYREDGTPIRGAIWREPSHKVTSPLEKNDHPELDTSPLLDDEGISKYQSLIGVLQWAITLGRFDVGTAVMTMSGFRVAPRQGHLDVEGSKSNTSYGSYNH